LVAVSKSRTVANSTQRVTSRCNGCQSISMGLSGDYGLTAIAA
jgi:uncharacterized pyridoxal phosphate-containing UPF0001 family protein